MDDGRIFMGKVTKKAKVNGIEASYALATLEANVHFLHA